MSIFNRLKNFSSYGDGRYHRTLLTWMCAGLLLLVGGSLVACGDDDDPDGEDIDEAQLRVEAVSSFDGNDMLRFDDPDGSVYSWTEAYVVVEEMELDLPGDMDDCDDYDDFVGGAIECDDGIVDDEELTIKGPFTVNLADGSTSLSDEDLTIPAIDYEEVDVEVNDLDEDDENDVDAPGDLVDHTFFGLADFEDNGNGRELFAQFEFDTEATVDEDDEDIAPEAGETLVIEFDIADLFDGIPLTECLDEGDLEERGDVVIVDDDSEGECSGAESEFESNFGDAIQARIEAEEDDEDGDVDAGDDEDDDPDAGDDEDDDPDAGDDEDDDPDAGDDEDDIL